ncbi:MAG: ATP-binding cassette domain-containing protein [bacterium]
MTTSPAPPALELAHVTVRYGSTTAVEDAGIVVQSGTVHALLGENGAGKTTLMQVAYGMVRPDAGTIRVRGVPRALTSPHQAISAGIGMVHQHFTLVPAMTVAENLALGGRGRLRLRDMVARVRKVSERTGFILDPAARADSLPVGAQQRVEIAKALAHDARILVLDEPTAVLAPAEVAELLRWLRSYVAEGNAAVIITHKLREALTVADDLTVLRRGRVAFTGSVGSASVESLTAAMIGSSGSTARITTGFSHDDGAPAPVFVAEHVTARDATGRVRVRDVSFTVQAGELVGIAAVEGSGQRELLRLLAGRLSVAEGSLQRPDKVGFVPEDRHQDAVLLDRSLTETVALRGAGARRGVVSWAAIGADAAALVDAYDIRAPSARVPVGSLSGGNQQKLVLARELEPMHDQPAPDALVVENPTRGLDVRAAAAVHQRLRDACARGAAIVAYSNDLDEVLLLASRVFVMYDGTLREVSGDRDAVGRAMLGLG